jgi:hypothetical protein
VLIGNRLNAAKFAAGKFAAAKYLSRDALAEDPDDADLARALIAAQAKQSHTNRAAASYQHLPPPLWQP